MSYKVLNKFLFIVFLSSGRKLRNHGPFVVEEIRNPNVEARNKFEFSKFKFSKPLFVSNIGNWLFEIVSSFEFSASDFENP